MNKKIIIYVLTGVSLFLISVGGSYLAFKGIGPKSSPLVSPEASGKVTSKKPLVNPSLPKTEICPLNGALFTKAEKDVWTTRRPLAVMIENSVDARPQSGLGSADIVYEAVAEGGITRFMGIFYCDAALSGNLMLAPVRSARIYFVNLMSEYSALYNHVGGAGNCDDPNVDSRAKALCLIDQANIKDLDQMGYAGAFKVCHRIDNRTGKSVAYEHTMACFLDSLYDKATELEWTNVDEDGIAWNKNFISWKFLSPTDKVTGASAKTISYAFWTTNASFNQSFNVAWEFDVTKNAYKRSNGGEVSIDLNTKEPLYFNTVVTQMVKETFTGDLEQHMLYDVVGSGKAKVFMNGVVTDTTWSKLSRTSRTIYKDATTGKEIKFLPGPMWISLVPSTNTITYQ